MNIIYSGKVIDLFNSPAHVYTPDKNYSYMGCTGDFNIGEYICLYFDIDTNTDNVLDSKIKCANFSAMGGVGLIAATEQFCAACENKKFNDIIKELDVNKIADELQLINKLYSINFILQAFYIILETVTKC